MEKVKITHEQADAIEKIKSGALMDVPLDNLIKAMIIGYEIEPEFKVGDWVVTKDGYIGEIEYINEVDKWANIGYSKDTKERGVCLAKTFKLNDIERHATIEETEQEKERRFWVRHNRDVWELRQGDVLSKKRGSYTVWEIHEDRVIFNEFGITKTWEELKSEFKVTCFAENRLDN